MYVPKHFDVRELEEIEQFVLRSRSADLVTLSAEGVPEATLMPCTWNSMATPTSEFGTLVMHMARANKQWKSISTGSKGLAIVRGPEAYISPSNYEGKSTDHKVVPTWNYQSVHFTGAVEISEDIELLRKIVTELTNAHESQRTHPWQASEADPKYFEAQLRGIVAVVLHVEAVEAKYKLSQNRSVGDRERVIADLGANGNAEEREIAQEMRRTLHTEG